MRPTCMPFPSVNIGFNNQCDGFMSFIVLVSLRYMCSYAGLTISFSLAFKIFFASIPICVCVAAAHCVS